MKLAKIIPPLNIDLKFFSKSLKKISHLEKENQELSPLRDYLLSLLMNG